jgi:hypothetical protein
MSSVTRELSSYFELAAAEVELVEEGLVTMSFGEYLVDHQVLSRAQLYEALREQDRHPGIPLGEIVAYMGYLPYAEIDRLLTQWHHIRVVEVSAGRRAPRPTVE